MLKYPQRTIEKGLPARTLRDKIAKAIFEAKYPDARWEHLHPNRLMRHERLKEADAVLKILKQ